jgi:hypothetical protein
MSDTPRTDAVLNGRLPCSGLESELIELARHLEAETEMLKQQYQELLDEAMKMRR